MILLDDTPILAVSPRFDAIVKGDTLIDGIGDQWIVRGISGDKFLRISHKYTGVRSIWLLRPYDRSVFGECVLDSYDFVAHKRTGVRSIRRYSEWSRQCLAVRKFPNKYSYEMDI